MTLCFLGAQPPEAVAPIGRAVDAALTGTGPVPLTLSAPVWLPRRRPRVLAVGLQEAAPSVAAPLAELQGRVSAALVAGGWYAPEGRPFFAHVTVARARGAAARRGPLPPAPPELRIRATEVALIRSRLGRGRAQYERLHTVALG